MEIALSDSNRRVGIKDYFALMKPRVMSLAVFTGMIGMLLAPGSPDPATVVAVLVSLSLGGGAAGAFNMWLERDLDGRMERTRNRPIPAGHISPANAFGFALLCAVASLFIMATKANLLAASLLLVTILFYIGVYTLWLKPRKPVSIVIGGAAGALPPVIGWAAATGGISLEPLLLFLITFLWTPAHFWALALVREEDYRRAGIPTLPVVAGRKSTLRQILLYTLALIPVTLLPFMFGLAGKIYLIGAGALGTVFLFQAIILWWEKDNRYAMSMFIGSLLYLTGIFTLLIVDRMFYV